jgi:Na+/proline symporter
MTASAIERKEGFLVAHRRVAFAAAGLAIASNWVWAPSLFVSAQQAYQNGLWGLAWFTIPNVLCLLLFAAFAALIRERVPDGYTLPAYMRDRHGPAVHRLYLTQMGLLALGSFAVQLLAGGVFIAQVTGLAFVPLTIGLAVFALSYSLIGGLRASLASDWLQMLIILAIAAVIVPWVIIESGGYSTAVAGFGGTSGKDPLLIALSFGIPTTIGLLSGPFGDQSFWQRTWATEAGRVKAAFIVAAAAFAVVPLTLGQLGFIAGGAGIPVESAQTVNITTVQFYLPAWTTIPFAVLILAGLVSTLDSMAVAFGSLVGHDGTRDVERAVTRARWGMVALGIGGVLIANIPGMTIVGLFIIYGTVRASTFWPTILTLRSDRVRGRWVAWGIGLAIAIGLPVSAYGNLRGEWPAIITASLLVWALSGGLTAWGMRRRT